jgi:hypothetical protein
MRKDIFLIVKGVIDEYDPYGLLSCHAPDNEYDLESAKIAELIDKNSTTDEIATIISEVFTHMFNKDFPKADFIQAAHDIKNHFDKYL